MTVEASCAEGLGVGAWLHGEICEYEKVCTCVSAELWRTFRGRDLFGGLLRQVRLLVQEEEGGDAQLPRPQQLHAALRRRRVVHHDVVQRSGRCRDSDVVLGVYGCQVACMHVGGHYEQSPSGKSGTCGYERS